MISTMRKIKESDVVAVGDRELRLGRSVGKPPKGISDRHTTEHTQFGDVWRKHVTSRGKRVKVAEL